MVKSRDLRLNNLVNEEVLGMCPIVGIEENSVWLGANHMNADRSIKIQKWHVNINAIEGVPLTVELLGKCNLEETDFKVKDADDKRGLFYPVFYAGGFLTHVYSLHQLQNLFYDLSGEELKIEL